MSHLNAARHPGIPVDHLRAELAVFPLASQAALELHDCVLDPLMRDEPGRRTASLWRAAEAALLGSLPGFSVDELVAVRDRLWFMDGVTTPRPLHDYLRRLAECLLTVEGDAARPLSLGSVAGAPSDGESEAVSRRFWRWLSFALPEDLLLAALGDGSGGPLRLEVVCPWLEHHLADFGYVESHLHMNAALRFTLAWNGALHAIAQAEAQADMFVNPGAELAEGRQLAPWLLRAAIVRYLLAGFLKERNQHRDFADFWRETRRQRLKDHIGLGAAAVTLFAVFGDLFRGKLRDTSGGFSELRLIYRQLTGIGQGGFPQDPEQALQFDPIGPLVRSHGFDPRVSEVRFLSQGLEYLKNNWDGSERAYRDGVFATLFFQVMRIRNLFYRHLTQRPLTPGLQWFVRFYGRAWAARRTMSRGLLLRSAAELDGRGRGLRSLEVRTTPPGSYPEVTELVNDFSEVLRRWLRRASDSVTSNDILRQDQDYVPVYRSDLSREAGNQEWIPMEIGGPARPEIGLVLHFSKERGGGAEQGIPKAHRLGSHRDPGVDLDALTNPSGYRYSSFYNRQRRAAGAVEWVLRQFPQTLALIRGVDVCSDELAVPDWVMLPLVKRIRLAAQYAAKLLVRCESMPGEFERAPALRTTLHTGEDFVHLLTGLRHVDEGIDAYELHQGDRIGHGLAMGVEPARWARDAGRVPLARETRLLDLAWEWRCYARQIGATIPGRLVYLEHEIARLSHECFGRALSPYDLELLIQDLRDPWKLYHVGFPNGPTPHWFAEEEVRQGERSWRITQADNLREPGMSYHRGFSNSVGERGGSRWELSRWGNLIDYLRDPETFKRGQVVDWFDAYEDVEALVALQAAVRKNVGERGIVVEINPTSNLLIGDLTDLIHHPMWRLDPPGGEGDAAPVSVCIGSDDPLMFASDLRQEYQLLVDSMALGGLSDEQARRWIDRVRKRGLESRFTLPAIGLEPFSHCFESAYLEDPLPI